ncbi:probable pleiotropic drug resistance proteins (PDR1-15), ABC superfamily [Cephalotrichum gorgonifer]|uniref:Probable pleiotropic drug resistance proteins (PDR1-15), ABC superfamily n=1 Tax=Cephalotrichum gorgonifer TaxID=2041049 RepID=A0AAE8MYF0_9PEZI|nr:probable pleiotropic drug resistance proteins (PDR1-15), ABC superfamily [Cephalotrichum gorgonifer]
MALSGSEMTPGGLPAATLNYDSDAQASQAETSYPKDGLRTASETDIESQEPYDAQRGNSSVHKRLTLTFKDLTIRVASPDEALGETLWSRVDPTQLLTFFRKTAKKRTILHNASGQVKPGEMLLVLGRPGAGCTSLLRALSNHRESFDEVLGETRYASMTHEEAKKHRQHLIFNAEDDIHFPTLSVNQTLKFALRNKVPNERPEHLEQSHHFIQHVKNGILDSLGIPHTKHTMVGNEFIRGVSGGERKRVSLAEVMATQSPVQFWDQPTRGLDSKTALEFSNTLRRDADHNGRTILATMYQAGNAIYDNFDKVLVLAEGRVIYYGPRSLGRSYFEELGFICPTGANVADFLTSVTVETERVIAPGMEEKVPRTPVEFERVLRGSLMYQDMMASMTDPDTLTKETDELSEAVRREKQRTITGQKSPYTVGLAQQVHSCIIRQFQIMMGDRLSLFIKVASATIQALVCGSLFYNLPETSASIFTRPGVIFFPVIYFLLEAMSETTASFAGRPILARHKLFALYRPTAFCIANAITDIPVVLIQATTFSLVLYFMSALQMDAGKFFTFWIIVNLCMLCFGQMFRMVGALFKNFGTASQVSGLLSTVLFVYGGYLIPFEKMHVWFRWIFYLNPGSYAFESLMANEFGGLQLQCESPQLVPFGPGYDNLTLENRGCTILGSDHTGLINGETYIDAQYNYSTGHIWRGFGVLVGFWIFFVGCTALAFELRKSDSGSGTLLYRRPGWGSKPDTKRKTVAKVEGGAELPPSSQVLRQSTFSWHNLDYFVKYQGQQKQLLDKVFGFVQPGSLVALMGSSGAGKTTLLDVLAQRKDAGEIYGSILIDGKPQGLSFQRTTGYCEQMDIHEATATVKEALVFSATLRQPEDVPMEEKLAYVDHIIDLLELGDISEALIGVPGSGLSIEQRKRVTLGVELVAKPTLLFLDEPTSGLDGQSAFNIVRFMRRLVDGGQTVLCTIHQPSAVLFDAFDALLLLAKGGRMAYFGDTGAGSAKVLDYFARNGAPCPPDTNPAEHIVEVIQGNAKKPIDWVDVWSRSPERDDALERLRYLNSNVEPSSSDDDNGKEFAVSKWTQFRVVLHRLMIQLWRSPDYVWNKVTLHIFAALFGGFTFWKLGDSSFDLQLRLFAIFNFVFVAPGCINQMQPFFLRNRDLFETREKKSKTYHWLAFIAAQAVSEIPYLIICATAYFGCWYFTAGFPVEARISGHIYLQMIFYELLYTSIGQAIAAYAPNEYFASVMNPLLLGAGLVSFCGVVAPYDKIPPFWRYWMYYLDPFNYLVGGLLGTIIWDVKVHCSPEELTSFEPLGGQSCGQYMADFFGSNAGYVENPDAMSGCLYCPYTTGADYAKTFNLREEYYAWRDTGITALFCLSSYGLVFLMMKLRSKKTKSSRGE